MLLQLPMFVAARHHHYVVSGMPVDGWMVAGMILIVAGLAAVTAGLVPVGGRLPGQEKALSVAPLDEAGLGPAHVGLLGVLTLAIAIDAQKPFTLAFILPGVAKEYGLSTPAHHLAGHLPVALLAFLGILGTVIGSLIWGFVADRYGRRSAILLAAMIFVATAACGAMPSFSYNLAMCFVMGLGAGGLLPIAYALLTETIPARIRGQVVVLVAGVGTGLGFLLTSAASTWLIPHFGWRVMWFIGLPSGLALVALNRFIPESPRFLIAQGRSLEAGVLLRRFGARVIEEPTLPGRNDPRTPAPSGLGRGLGALTGALVVYGLGWGIVNFGFLTWLPTAAGHAGLSVGRISGILTNAALFSLPGAVLVSWAYGRWSTKATMVAVAALTAASLGVFAALGDTVVAHPALLTAMLVLLLVSLWGVISVLAPYSAEVYPTRHRAGGAGVAAGASKLGGVLALGMGVAGVAPPGLAGSAGLTAGAMALGALAIAAFGIETRRRRLEDIAPTRMVPVSVGS